MKTNNWFALLACLGGVALPLKSMAQGWTNVLVYRPAGDSLAGAAGYGLATDAAGNVFTCGYAGSGSSVGGFLLEAAQADETAWSLSDSNDGSTFYDVGRDSQGNLYAVGHLDQLVGQQTQQYWYVRKSSDGGFTWNTVDQYQYISGFSQSYYVNMATGFTADNAGNIYVVGYSADMANRDHWLVRKSSDGGQNWTLVNDLTGYDGGRAACVPVTGAVFVAGDLVFGGLLHGWIVQRSTDNGTNWETVDQPFASGASGAVASDGAGNIYVVGTAAANQATPGDTSTNLVWVTRKSSDGGNTWQTVDAWTMAQNKSALARGVAVSSSGIVVVVGSAGDSSGLAHWLARTNSPTGSWASSDDFQLGDGGTAFDVTADAAGNILVAGDSFDSNYNMYCGVRMLPALLPPPPTLSLAQNGNQLLLSWPTNAAGFLLQSSQDLVNWSNSVVSPGILGAQYVLTNTVFAAPEFFRLKQ